MPRITFNHTRSLHANDLSKREIAQRRIMAPAAQKSDEKKETKRRQVKALRKNDQKSRRDNLSNCSTGGSSVQSLEHPAAKVKEAATKPIEAP